MTTQKAGQIGGRNGRGKSKARTTEQSRFAGRLSALARYGGAAYRAGRLRAWLDDHPGHGDYVAIAKQMITKYGRVMQD